MPTVCQAAPDPERAGAMELPFQDAFESFLAKLLDEAEAELSGTPPTPRRRSAQPKPAARHEVAGDYPVLAPASRPMSNGQASPD